MAIEFKVESPSQHMATIDEWAIGPYDSICSGRYPLEIAEKLLSFSASFGFGGFYRTNDTDDKVNLIIIVDERKSNYDYWKGYSQIMNGQTPTTFAEDEFSLIESRPATPVQLPVAIEGQT